MCKIMLSVLTRCVLMEGHRCDVRCLLGVAPRVCLLVRFVYNYLGRMDALDSVNSLGVGEMIP